MLYQYDVHDLWTFHCQNGENQAIIIIIIPIHSLGNYIKDILRKDVTRHIEEMLVVGKSN